MEWDSGSDYGVQVGGDEWRADEERISVNICRMDSRNKNTHPSIKSFVWLRQRAMKGWSFVLLWRCYRRRIRSIESRWKHSLLSSSLQKVSFEREMCVTSHERQWQEWEKERRAHTGKTGEPASAKAYEAIIGSVRQRGKKRRHESHHPGPSSSSSSSSSSSFVPEIIPNLLFPVSFSHVWNLSRGTWCLMPPSRKKQLSSS